jgi:hypothetical protein
VKHWFTWISNTTSITDETYTWISNTTSITGETLIYMNIKHYKYNWWNIDIHEYQTLQV